MIAGVDLEQESVYKLGIYFDKNRTFGLSNKNGSARFVGLPHDGVDRLAYDKGSRKFRGSWMVPTGKASFKGGTILQRCYYDLLVQEYLKEGEDGRVDETTLQEIVQTDITTGRNEIIHDVSALLEESQVGWKIITNWARGYSSSIQNKKYSLRPERGSEAFMLQSIQPAGNMVKDLEAERQVENRYSMEDIECLVVKALGYNNDFCHQQAEMLYQLQQQYRFPVGINNFTDINLCVRGLDIRDSKLRSQLNAFIYDKFCAGELGEKSEYYYDYIACLLLRLYQIRADMLRPNYIKKGQKPNNGFHKDVRKSLLVDYADTPEISERFQAVFLPPKKEVIESANINLLPNILQGLSSAARQMGLDYLTQQQVERLGLGLKYEQLMELVMRGSTLSRKNNNIGLYKEGDMVTVRQALIAIQRYYLFLTGNQNAPVTNTVKIV